MSMPNNIKIKKSSDSPVTWRIAALLLPVLFRFYCSFSYTYCYFAKEPQVLVG